MCRNLAAFIAGAVAMSFLGLGARVCLVDAVSGTAATCPPYAFMFWIAAFAVPLFVGLFMGAYGGSRGWMCAGLAAVLASIVRTAVTGFPEASVLQASLVVGASLLYVALAVAGGIVGGGLKVYRKSFGESEAAYRPRVQAISPDSGQYHSHDNLSF